MFYKSFFRAVYFFLAVSTLLQAAPVSGDEYDLAPTSFITPKDKEAGPESWWRRTKRNEYQQKYPSYIKLPTNTYTIVGRESVMRFPGTVIRRSDNLEIFIPDTGQGREWLGIRRRGASFHGSDRMWRQMANVQRDPKLIAGFRKQTIAQRRIEAQQAAAQRRLEAQREVQARADSRARMNGTLYVEQNAPYYATIVLRADNTWAFYPKQSENYVAWQGAYQIRGNLITFYTGGGSGVGTLNGGVLKFGLDLGQFGGGMREFIKR